MALITDIADEIVSSLNTHTFRQAFTAERAYAPSFELKDMQTLHVTVVPASAALTLTARGPLTQTDMEIFVGVQKRLSSDVEMDIAQLDSLMGLVEEISDFIKGKKVFEEAVWIGTDNDPIYSPEHIKQMRQFTSVLTFTYRIIQL